jgi:hypothetical protein
LARKRIKVWRDEEMEFLGMIRAEKPLQRSQTARYEIGYGRFKEEVAGTEE